MIPSAGMLSHLVIVVCANVKFVINQFVLKSLKKPCQGKMTNY